MTAHFEEHDGQIAEKPLFSQTIIFNESNHVIEQLNQNPDPFHACASDSCSTEEMAALTEEQKAEVAQVFAPGSEMSKYTHTYDTEGRLIESKLMMMGMEVNRQTFAYDEAGNRSEEVSYDAGGSVAKAIFTREYDQHGNWTMELVSNASS